MSDTGKISDGYHTFDELYEHRHALFLALMKQSVGKVHCWYSHKHADGSGWAGWFIAGMTLPTGEITYHLPVALMAVVKATGAEELALGKPWDGHTANDVVIRLNTWTSDAPSSKA